MPRVLLVVVLALLGSLTLAILYTTRVNPEIRHFLGSHQIKSAWAERMTREHGHKVVVYGGSSCEFSIDGGRLLRRHNLPCANLGRGAGMGAVVLTMAALEQVRQGDTLIVALEPALLTEPPGVPNLGIQFSIASGHPEWIRQPLGVTPVSWAEAVVSLRPGGLHVFTMLGKLVQGRPLYRYDLANMEPSGFHQTPLRLAVSGPPGHGVHLPSGALSFLESLRRWCDARQVRVAYSMPWGFTPEEVLASTRTENARFLLQVMGKLPVLKDPVLGAHPVREHFADTAWHLTPEAAALRTDQFARQVKEWERWSFAELQSLAPNIER